MNLKPLSDHIILEPIKEEMVTEAGIILPETAEREKPQKGKVVAVGPGRMKDDGTRIPVEVKVGDIVIFHQYGPSEIKIDKKDYLVAKEDDIIAIIE
jgi:chaperonin GroES